MSKERLEEFREFIDFMYESIDIEDHQRFIAISESMIKDGWFKWIYRFANEQAERVQELEEIKDAKIVLVNKGDEEKRYVEQEKMIELEKAFDKLDSSYIDEVKKNQRYREAIEKAIHETYEEYDPLWIVETLQKALEGSE